MKVMLSEALIALGDDALILGHRLSEWCGHAPMLEEDLSLPNIGLDLIGQARNLYCYAGELEGQGRSEDDLAFLRNEREYRHITLVERANQDFAITMLRQLYFAAFMHPFWREAQTSKDKTIAGIAGKAVKEHAYHLRHAGEWVIRLGDGTPYSHERMQAAVAQLHQDTDELFAPSDAMAQCAQSGLLPDITALESEWSETISTIFQQAQLEMPEADMRQNTSSRLVGRAGIHTEALGHVLSELQYLQRSYPGASW